MFFSYDAESIKGIAEVVNINLRNSSTQGKKASVKEQKKVPAFSPARVPALA